MVEHAATKPQSPYRMRNVATAYASSASTEVAAYEDLPGHHLLAVRNLIATTHDESYHGSASELPPCNLAWVCGVGLLRCAGPGDVPAVPRCCGLLVRCSDDSSTGSYDPARECFMVAIGDLVDGANVVGAGDGEAHQDPGTSAPRNPKPTAPPTSPMRDMDINVQLALACELEAKLTEEYHMV
jgi:hypothetical protein